MMTGRLHPYLPELSLRDYNIYLRYMRGVKYQVYLDFGIVPYGALFSYRGGVMALLADSLAGRQATCREIRLPGSLSRVPGHVPDQGHPAGRPDRGADELAPPARTAAMRNCLSSSRWSV